MLYKCLLLLHIIKMYAYIHTIQNLFARVIEVCVCVHTHV